MHAKKEKESFWKGSRFVEGGLDQKKKKIKSPLSFPGQPSKWSWSLKGASETARSPREVVSIPRRLHKKTGLNRRATCALHRSHYWSKSVPPWCGEKWCPRVPRCALCVAERKDWFLAASKVPSHPLHLCTPKIQVVGHAILDRYARRKLFRSLVSLQVWGQ